MNKKSDLDDIIEQIRLFSLTKENRWSYGEYITNLFSDLKEKDFPLLEKKLLDLVKTFVGNDSKELTIIHSISSFLKSKGIKTALISVAQNTLKDSRFKDKEFWADILIEFDETEIIHNFLVENPMINNRFLIEKTVLYLADSNYDINDEIKVFLTSKDHIVKNASLIYLEKKGIDEFKNELIDFFEKEEDPDLIISSSDLLFKHSETKNYEVLLKKINELKDDDIDFYEEAIENLEIQLNAK